jgi:hypothetical protein
MAYNPNLIDLKDQVRLKIGDVFDQEFLSDQEIQFILDSNGGIVAKAAAACCRAIAARFARNTDYRFSTLWQDASQAYDHFMSLAEILEQEDSKKTKLVPLFTASKKGTRIFDVGMMDNPSAIQGDAGLEEDW